MLLQLNTQRLDEIVESAIGFTKDQTIEQDIVELVEARKKIDEAMKQVQARFKEQFILGKMENSIEGDLIKVIASPSGSLFKMVDEQKVHPSLIRMELDSKKVQEWVDKNQKLPEGIDYNDNRGVAIRIGVK